MLRIERFTSHYLTKGGFLNESIQAAKDWLRKKALEEEKKKNPNLQISVSEIDNIERSLSKEKDIIELKKVVAKIKRKADENPDFLEIKKLLLDGPKSYPGFALLLTKFKIGEGLPFNEIVSIFNKLLELSQYLSKLPMPIDRYAKLVPNEADSRPASERLSDDLTNLEILRATDRFVKNLPGEFTAGERALDTGTKVSSIKDAYRNAPEPIKKKVQQIAFAFEQMGMKNGVVDPQKNKSLQDQFFKNIRRYRTLADVINAAQRHLKGANLENELNYLEKIEEVNKRFGIKNGCEIVYFIEGILVTKVFSFQANAILNRDTGHCIATSSSYWRSYVDSKFNLQYYIRDFNKTPDDNFYIIGITIDRKSNPVDCHLKDDTNYLPSINGYIKRLGLDSDAIFKGMSDEEYLERKRKIEADEEIVKLNINMKDLKKYINWGADPNISNGKPLSNAVRSKDLERVKYLVQVGADTKLGNPLASLRSDVDANSLQIVKFLVKEGANIDANIIDQIIADYDLMYQVIDSGTFDVNQNDGLPLRKAMTIGIDHPTADLKPEQAEEIKKKIVKLLVDYGADLSTRRWYLFKNLSLAGDKEMLTYIMTLAKEKGIWPSATEWTDIIKWSKMSDSSDSKAMTDWLVKISTSV